jgi:NADPH-dependent glutamate synthase beta subunit-like oxidoreductase
MGSKKVVAICGGAVAGSEAASVCAESGAIALVFEQNVRPYGKIEDGLPRWHDKLRAKEYGRIDENLSRDGVHFVPRTRLGEDISFGEWADDLSAVLLACGAWADRELPVPDANRFVGKGLLYQNPFVHWFNHYLEDDYDGPRYEVPDGAIVVGGGLASIDVAKILNFEIFGRALRERGVEADAVTLEHQGIPEVAAKAGIDIADLGVHGCTLFYRRRKQDMPLTPAKPKNEAMRAKIEGARLKIVDKLERKYLVRIQDCSAPKAIIEDGERMGGLVFQKTEIVDGKVVPLDGSELEARAALTVSSIGSVPERIDGIPHRGELFDYADWDSGALSGLERAFGLGNALTGRGNIKDSRKSAKSVASKVMELPLPALSENRVAEVLDQVAARQKEVGYDGDYRAWIATHPPFERR